MVQAPTNHRIEWFNQKIPERIVEVWPSHHMRNNSTEPLVRRKGMPGVDSGGAWWIFMVRVLIHIELLPRCHRSILDQRPHQVQHSQNRSRAPIHELPRGPVRKKRTDRIDRRLKQIQGMVHISEVNVIVFLAPRRGNDDSVRWHSYNKIKSRNDRCPKKQFEKEKHNKYQQDQIKQNNQSKEHVRMKSTSEKSSISEMPHKINSAK